MPQAVWLLTMVIVLVGISRAMADVGTWIANLEPNQPSEKRVAAANALRDNVRNVSRTDALRTVKPLETGCADKSAAVRLACVVALGLVQNEHSIPCSTVLVERMFDESSDVRSNAAAVVSLFDTLPAAAAPILEQHASSPIAPDRAAALVPLAKSDPKSKRVRAIVRQAVHDRDPRVRANATSALWRMTKDLKQVVPLWLKSVEDGQMATPTEEMKAAFQETSIVAAFQLRSFGTQRIQDVGPILLRHLESPDVALRRASARTLGALANESADVADALRQLGLVKALKKRLEDKDVTVRNEASRALISLGQ